MRAGAYTVHQSLTAEAAAVLKLALALARRRGHAQVTPLHVAFALLSSACSPQPGAAAYGMLRRACLRSYPASASVVQHPLQCRALELCFNVALNRLPAGGSGMHSPPSPSPSGVPFVSSLINPSPTLSNALVAALKRAQANQRRGCVELQQPPAASSSPPLLAIKVELEQLIVSILDDPSVSRVMREAGFSSATVKSNLEDESALMLSSSSSSPPPPAASGFGLWPAQFMSSPGMAAPCCNDDVRAVLEVMVPVRKQGRRTNPVIVGDSVSMAEAVAGEVLRRLERGEVPEELAGARLLKLHLSYVHVRLMSRADVDAKAAELRRSVDGGLVVYVGDLLRWVLDEGPTAGGGGGDHTASSYSPVEHMVAELGRLLHGSSPARGRVWLVATSSYQTYTRCQDRRRQPSLESAWALQAVVVPAGSGTGLALNNLHSCCPSATQQAAIGTRQQLAQSSSAMAEQPPMALGGEQEDKLCRKLHVCSRRRHDPCSASCFGSGPAPSPSQWWSPPPRRGFREPMEWQDMKTTLALGSLPLSDSATSNGRAPGSDELERRLRKNIPWQPEAVAEIVEAVAGGRSCGRKGVSLFLKGSDHAAKRRAAAVIGDVISLRLWTTSEVSPSFHGDAERKAEIEPPQKRARHGAGHGHGLSLDLNLYAPDDSDDDDGALPSDITHESDTSEHERRPRRRLESVATRVVTLDAGQHAAAAIRAALVGAVGREVLLDGEASEALAAASGHFLGEVLERWATEVFEPAAAAAAAVRNGGKVVVLGMGPVGLVHESGFMGSVLPSRIHVD